MVPPMPSGSCPGSVLVLVPCTGIHASVYKYRKDGHALIEILTPTSTKATKKTWSGIGSPSVGRCWSILVIQSMDPVYTVGTFFFSERDNEGKRRMGFDWVGHGIAWHRMATAFCALSLYNPRPMVSWSIEYHCKHMVFPA